MIKTLEISSFYTSVPKIMIICYTVPEIWHLTDVIVIFHFGLFFVLLPPNSPKNKNFKKNGRNNWRYHNFTQLYQKSWSSAILFLRHGVWQLQLLYFILGYFLLFYAPNIPKYENFKTMAKKPGDNIILQKCTKNHDHMLYCSWDIVRDGCNCNFSFWAIFCPFSPSAPIRA